MLKTISSTYKTYAKTFPVILLYALPLLVLSSIQVYFLGINEPNKGVAAFIMLSLFVVPLVGAATDVAIYRFLMKFGKVNPLISIKAYLYYLIAQIGIGIIGVLPIFAFKFILDKMGLGNISLYLSLFLNLFVGIFLIARLSIALPLIVAQKKFSLQTFWQDTNDTYPHWMMVSVLVYLPYIILNYGVSCPYLNMAVTTLFSFVFIVFNTLYAQDKFKKQLAAGSVKVAINQPVTKPAAKPEKETPVMQKAPVKKSPAKKAPAKKPAAPKAAKASTPEKAKTPVKAPEKAKAPASTPVKAPTPAKA